MKKVFRLCFALLLVMLVSMPVFAHVTDETGILSQEEVLFLDSYAGQVSEEYGCGVYIMVVEDYYRYATGQFTEIFDVTAQYYHNQNLGIGPDRNGILLMVDLRYREAAFFVYGEDAEYALNDYGQLLLEEAFIDDFREDDWYQGLLDFVEQCEYSLDCARAGEPVRESKAPMIGVVWLCAFVTAAIVCGVCYSGMKTANKRHTAAAYVSPEGLHLTKRDDFFTHRTVTRVKKQQSSGGSGGSSHRGHGGSGRSSRF